MSGDKISELKKRVDEQCKALNSLASSMEGEDRLGQLLKRVEGQCEALSSLAGGVSGEGFVLSWPETRQMFLQYLEFKRYEPANARNMLNYLDRFVRGVKRAVRRYADVFAVNLWAKASFEPCYAGLV